MGNVTPNRGYPYPLTSDFGDVQDTYQLATAIDTDLRSSQAAFTAFMGRPSFIARQSANGSGYISGSSFLNCDVVEWDNTGQPATGFNTWQQPKGQQPMWWFFGANLLVPVISGTPTVGDLALGDISVTTTNVVSGVQTTIDLYQRNDYSDATGDKIAVWGMAAIYRGNANVLLTLNGSTGQRTIGAGSRFWGFQLGPVV